jgi:hypothetical protein
MDLIIASLLGLVIGLAPVVIIYLFLLLRSDRAAVERRRQANAIPNARGTIQILTMGRPPVFVPLLMSSSFRALLTDEGYRRALTEAQGAGTAPRDVPLPQEYRSLGANPGFQALLEHPEYPEWMLDTNAHDLVQAVEVLREKGMLTVSREEPNQRKGPEDPTGGLEGS